jgi:diadenosine tetraphosphate (Ap4A) HIT family hydrolase
MEFEASDAASADSALPAFRSDCSFCDELLGEAELLHCVRMPGTPKNRVLQQTRSWVVVPSIGPIVPGHILLVSTRHFESVLTTNKQDIEDLERLISLCSERLTKIYGSTVALFEHGMAAGAQNLSGACIDHAHLHLVPCEADFSGYALGKIERWISAASILELHDLGIQRPYLLVGSASDPQNVHLHECYDPIPSQYLRKVFSVCVGKPAHWDWRDNPNSAGFLQTMRDWRKYDGQLS